MSALTASRHAAWLSLLWLGAVGAAGTPGTTDATAGSRSLRDCPECPEMVLIEPGDFLMGSPDTEAGRTPSEGPRHEVRIPAPFALGRHEITRAQLEAFVVATGREMRGCRVLGAAGWEPDASRSWRDPGFEQGDDHPAVCVNWRDATAYVEWLSATTGRPYRLPTEAEWEYAARGGTRGARFWGEDASAACAWANVADLATKARYPTMRRHHDCDDGFVHTAPAGSHGANPFGLADMLGNVWEWTADCWSPDYRDAPTDGRARTDGDCSRRVVRGGSWGLAPEGVRSASRNWFDAPNRSSVLGFRVARTLPPD